MILSMQAFDEFLQYHHFKIENLRNSRKYDDTWMLHVGRLVAPIYLKDAYSTEPISKDDEKYLKIYI